MGFFFYLAANVTCVSISLTAGKKSTVLEESFSSSKAFSFGILVSSWRQKLALFPLLHNQRGARCAFPPCGWLSSAPWRAALVLVRSAKPMKRTGGAAGAGSPGAAAAAALLYTQRALSNSRAAPFLSSAPLS